MHPRLEQLTKELDTSMQTIDYGIYQFPTTDAVVAIEKIRQASPALIAALAEIRERAADWDVSEHVIDEIIAKHLGAGE